MFLLEVIKIILTTIGAIFVFVQYRASNLFKRSQYLSELWRRFYNDAEFTKLFSHLEENNVIEIAKMDNQIKYRFLGYLEEIALFEKRSIFQIEKLESAEMLNLFQFHFYYLYQKESTKNAFWKSIVSTSITDENEAIRLIDNEIKNHYWSKQYLFSVKAKHLIEG